MGRKSKKGTLLETERIIVTVPKHLSEVFDYIAEYRRFEKSTVFQQMLEYYIRTDEVSNEKRGIDAIINDYNKKVDTATEVNPPRWKYVKKYVYSDHGLLETMLKLRDNYELFDEFCEAMFERFVDEGKINLADIPDDDEDNDQSSLDNLD